MTQEFSAGCIAFRLVEHKAQLAFMLDRFGKWTFPKGHLEAGESAFAAARRELSEELGLTPAELVTCLGKSSHNFKKAGRAINKQTEWFLVKVAPDASLQVREPAQVAGVEWVALSEAQSRLGYKNLRSLLRRAKQVIISCYFQ
jgi:8-oxo-dGTP pyrophosphatase MutT (NUDIX family)